MAREHELVDALRDPGSFVCDTAPLVYWLERSGAPGVRRVLDALFGRVAEGEVACLVSSISAAELLIGPYRAHPPAVTVVDGFLRSPHVGVVAPSLGIAHAAARLVARRIVGRLGDAFVAATAADLDLPLVTGDRRLARAVGGLLVQDFADSRA